MKLYKYYSFKNGLDALCKDRIYVTPPKYFNDPFEFTPIFSREFTEKEVSEFISMKRHKNNLRRAFKRKGIFDGTKHDFDKWIESNKEKILPDLKKDFLYASEVVRKQFVEIVSDVTGVSSFTTKNNNLLMWSHYADSHKGIVVGYSLDEKQFKATSIRKVAYSNDRVAIDPRFIFRVSEFTPDAYKVIYSKSINWEYEEEFRLVSELRHCKRDERDGKTYYYMSLSPQNTIEVYFGMKMHDDRIEKIKSNIKGKKIKKYLTGLSNSKYEVEFHDLD